MRMAEQVSIGTERTFYQRCASALTHPATITALVLLFINDLALKPLWSDPWTTGKVSDFAWTVFASPLLAFILSLVARDGMKRQRAAFISAYIGLPILYVAFNTFASVHDFISRLLMLATGAAEGSPLDATDSLVIPLGLGVALWVWRRPVARPGSLRVRLALLAAAVATLATLATPAPYDHYPDGRLGHLDDETIYWNSTWPQITTDGGLTWQDAWDVLERLPDRDSVRWGGNQAQIPKGLYEIERDSIVRVTDSGKEAIFSFLEDESDKRFFDYLDRRFGCGYQLPCPSYYPINMVYDERTSNVIVSMGYDSVMVSEGSGDWKQVAAFQNATPRNPSTSHKLSTVFDHSLFWWVAASVSVSGIAVPLALSRFSTKAVSIPASVPAPRVTLYSRIPSPSTGDVGRMDDNPILSKLIGCAAVPLAIALTVLAILFIPLTFTLSESAAAPVVELQMVGIILLTGIPLAAWGLALRSLMVVGVIGTALSVIGSSVALTTLLTGTPTLDRYWYPVETTPAIGLSMGLFHGLIAVMVFMPPWRTLPVLPTAFAAMMGFFALALLIAVLQGFHFHMAKLYASLMVLAVAFVLTVYLRRSIQRKDDSVQNP